MAHTRLQLLQLSFARNGSKELVTTCNDDSVILWIALVPFQTYSGHTNMELDLPSIEEDAAQIVYIPFRSG